MAPGRQTTERRSRSQCVQAETPVRRNVNILRAGSRIDGTLAGLCGRRRTRHRRCLGSTRLMIVWSLHGSSSEFVCSIEKGANGYRLVIRSASAVIVDDVLPDVRRARWKADLIRNELVAMGYVARA